MLHSGTMSIDPAAIRAQFPIFHRPERWAYLDSAASAQKPEAVLQAMDAFARGNYANVHRGMHPLAERATDAFEAARSAVRRFLRAAHVDEVIFTKSSTEALNLVARSWGKAHLRKGDAVVLTLLEHHSVIVPWLQLKEEIGIEVLWADIDDHGNLKLEELTRMLRRGDVRLVSVTGLSNVLGVRPPLRTIVEQAHAAGALACVDASQLAAHHPIDVQELDCDFLALTAHKTYGPTGIGALYARRELLKAMPPFLGGGGMILTVTREGFTPADAPQKFEAGTPPIIEAVGWHAALEWLKQYDWKDIEEYEMHLLTVAAETLSEIPKLRILGPLAGHTKYVIRNTTYAPSGCLSFVIPGIHPHDLTTLLGEQGFCLRAGHHCTEPLHRRLGIDASTRLSVALYNTEEEIRALGPALLRAIKTLRQG